MLRVFRDIEDVRNEWRKMRAPDFLDINFLKIYCTKHPNIKHLFIIDENIRVYAHIFRLKFNTTRRYLKHNSFVNMLLRFFSFDVLYLTNSFITNIPSFISDNKISLDTLLNTIKDNYSIIIIPDFLFEKTESKDNNYTKIEIEEEMILEIRSEWGGVKDYMSDLRKKYRNKVKEIMIKTNALEIRSLDSENLEKHTLKMQKLFSQVVESARFKGPDFNVSSFALFVEKGFMKVDGYFLNDKLVGFSSQIEGDRKLYSYFTGFDKELNKSVPIYGRILIENIDNAIKLKKDHLILGRTANEYKSNFGAFPIKSYIYLSVKNKFLNVILSNVYTKLRINQWTQRHPFKALSNE